jgi:hypothetical protein
MSKPVLTLGCLCRQSGVLKTLPDFHGKIRCLLAKKREADFHYSDESVFVMNLKKVKNIALTISLVAFAIGFSDGGESIFWYMGRPVGAILFAVFMIFTVLEKESLLLDKQRVAANKDIGKSLGGSAPQKSSNKENCAPALTTATSH